MSVATLLTDCERGDELALGRGPDGELQLAAAA